MRVCVKILARRGKIWEVIHVFYMDHDNEQERRHLGFLCRYLFEAGQGVTTTPV